MLQENCVLPEQRIWKKDEENLFLKKDYSPLLYIDVNSVILLDQL